MRSPRFSVEVSYALQGFSRGNYFRYLDAVKRARDIAEHLDALPNLLTMLARPRAKLPLMCFWTNIAAAIRLFLASACASSSFAFLRG